MKFSFFCLQVNTVQFVLEEEGSSSSPATISKVPGTSHLSSTPPPLPPSSGSSKSITELGSDDFGFGGFGLGQPSTGHVTTKSVSCTKTTRRKVVQTKDGPVETMEEVYSGGPECQRMADLSKGGMSSLFPTLTHASSSSSSSVHTKTDSSGGTKGSLLGDSKTGFMDPFGTGLDLGGFMTDDAEEDVPDLHARSVKSATVERQDDYVGKGTKTSALE